MSCELHEESKVLRLKTSKRIFRILGIPKSLQFEGSKTLELPIFDLTGVELRGILPKVLYTTDV